MQVVANREALKNRFFLTIFNNLTNYSVFLHSFHNRLTSL
ncbi:hypothetical protein EP10_000165 [Geobacillus icigianus]|uniref:Uncharacterized protein n=1 Tax=Geobacillus icigianus TaxID=1430331 RepID=A0ABU6BBQ9_9BACL|nr:hypothetical protein B4113_0974 [Geobacillus sp. B4113_201601]MEB3749326.1 hypothetical protein [Geobacillus icigianus]